MSETLAEIGEFGLIDRIDRLLREDGMSGQGVTVGIGDDTAAFRPRPGVEILVTCDCMVEGRHFLPEHISPMALGRRAMAMNISDIGAMGGRPLYALVSLGLRSEMRVADVEAMYRGFLQELNPFGAAVIGGNLTKAADASFIDVTLIGEVEAGGAVRRSTARPGDAVLVTGYPGQAAAGLQLLLMAASPGEILDHPLVRAYSEPGHRAREGRAVGESRCATAMIDTSDGFLGDLGHICEESGVGVDLIRDQLPVSADLVRGASQLSRDPHELFLGDSDDYELIITCPSDGADRIRSAIAAVSDVPVTEVGRVTDERGAIHLILHGGKKRRLAAAGWDHFGGKGRADA